jgi:DNA-binding PadR family transcriptional regulator
MAFVRNPTFKRFWGDGKTPELQIKILKQIIFSGQLSKKKVTTLFVNNNYSDVSDAMDDLLSKGFIKLSEKIRTSGRNPEKFYRITEEGLKAILEVKLYQEEFWRAIILLCLSSKKPISEAEFKEYYRKFEDDFLGHLDIQGYFFLTPLFDSILDQWLQAHNDLQSISLSQKVMECLAINGSSTIQKLKEKIRTKEEDLLKVIDNYLVQSNNDDNSSQKSFYISTNTSAKSNIKDDITKKKNFFYDLICHTLIIANETPDKGIVYELSLFGIMVVVAIISYHFTGMDTYHNPGGDINGNNADADSIIRPSLFYNKINQTKYYDTIVKNYKFKVPLIFGKWDFLKSALGTMLYDGFDFLIYKSSRSDTIDCSIWSFGSKEFYDDGIALTRDAIRRLDLIYTAGTSLLSEYRQCQPWIANDLGIISVYKKLREIKKILKYTNIVFSLQKLKNGNLLPDELKNMKSCTTSDIKNIENIFRDEISFLFYLSLITITLPASHKRKYPPRKIEHTQHGIRLIIYPEDEEETRELFNLGTPQQRLMIILAKDKEIKQWFSEWIGGIIKYRSKVLDKMDEFYDEVNNADKKLKIDNAQPHIDKKAKIISYPDEYNISRICSDFNSDFNSVYDYSSASNYE